MAANAILNDDGCCDWKLLSALLCLYRALDATKCSAWALLNVHAPLEAVELRLWV